MKRSEYLWRAAEAYNEGRISEDVKVTEETKRVLEIRVYGGNIHE